MPTSFDVVGPARSLELRLTLHGAVASDVSASEPPELDAGAAGAKSTSGGARTASRGCATNIHTDLHCDNDKDTGLRNLPFCDFEHNRVWLEIVRIAHDLIAWTQRLLLSGELAKAEPKGLRYRLLHVAARLAFHARTATMRLQASGPWATDLAAAFHKLTAL